MRHHSPKLVSETLLVSGELIRVAILWKEKWRKGLDEAYHQYYYERYLLSYSSERIKVFKN
jgi:FKBP12-rapamycin complex-associated protein